jgi:hypothetical protein
MENFSINIEKTKKARIKISETNSILKLCRYSHSLIVQNTTVNKVFFFKVKNIDYTNSSEKGKYCYN